LVLKAAAVAAAALSAVIVWGEVMAGASKHLSPLHLLIKASENEFIAQVGYLLSTGQLHPAMPHPHAF
jgi:hypothetical protein